MIYATTRNNPRQSVAAAEPVAIQRMPAPAAGPLTRPRLTPLTQNSPSGDSAALPPVLSDAIEARTGISMAGVSVHRNSPVPATIGAHAFAQGADIHLGPGQDSHLAHEAWHIAQQRQGRVPRRRRIDGQPVNDDNHLEHEATAFSATLSMGDAMPAPMVSAPQPAAPSATVAPHDAPIQGNFHAPPADMGQRVQALRQTLADADNSTRANGDWYGDQQQHMHELEGHIHTWFRDHGHLATEDQRQQMAAHLNMLEDHGTDLMGVQLTHNHPLWLPAGIPGKEAARANQIWDSVRNNQGNLQVSTKKPDFHRNTMAGIAKLLQGQHGRNMLDELNKAPEGKEIPEPRVLINDDWSDVPVFGKDQPEGSYATPIGIDTDDSKNRKGMGSYVRIVTTDRTMLSGEEETSIPSPTYVGLAHELGHALHNLRGVNDQQKEEEFNSLSLLDFNLWDCNKEEYTNITDNENPIRMEHNLPTRKYYFPPLQLAVTKQDRKFINKFNEGYKGKDPAPDWIVRGNPNFGAVPGHLNQRFDPTDPSTYQHASFFYDYATRHIDNHIATITHRDRLNKKIEEANDEDIEIPEWMQNKHLDFGTVPGNPDQRYDVNDPNTYHHASFFFDYAVQHIDNQIAAKKRRAERIASLKKFGSGLLGGAAVIGGLYGLYRHFKK